MPISEMYTLEHDKLLTFGFDLEKKWETPSGDDTRRRQAKTIYLHGLSFSAGLALFFACGSDCLLNRVELTFPDRITERPS